MIMGKRKITHFIVILILIMAVHLSCSSHSKTYLVGCSLDRKLTIEETLDLYMEAVCKGDKKILCLLYTKGILDFCTGKPDRRYCFEPMPEACQYDVRKIFYDGTDEKMFIEVWLNLEGDKDQIYRCGFLSENGKIFVVTRLSPRPDATY
jgi:hypothetical protein